jgi:outer membrane protein
MARPRGSRIARHALIAGMVAMVTAPVLADDLRDALVMAYNSNPTIQAARAQQRAVDEGVPIARSASLPSLSGTASYSEFVEGVSSNPLAADRNFDAQLNLGMPIYAGGGIRNSIYAPRKPGSTPGGPICARCRKRRVQPGRCGLHGCDPGRSRGRLNRANVERLAVNLQATKDRFEIGDLTRTDVAQSESRLATARGATRSAEANLISARERYIQIVGKAPDNLQTPPPLVGLPASADDAVAIALDSNPDLLAARQRAKAAGYDTAAVGANRLPRVSVFANTGYNDALGSNKIAGAVQSTTSSTVGVRATVPLFQGGLPAAQRRQAQARESATLEQEIGIERSVIASVRAAYRAVAPRRSR